MATFKDAAGRQWDVTLTVSAIKVVRERLKIDLGTIMQDETGLANLLYVNPEGFVNMLWVLCERQAKAMTPAVDDMEFGYGFGGATIEAASDAMMTAIVDFFPRSKVAQAIKGKMGRQLAAMDARMIRDVEAAMDKSLWELNGTAGNSPESAA